jgi:DNA-directed RNA polymerase specialized sigma24 family protein
MNKKEVIEQLEMEIKDPKQIEKREKKISDQVKTFSQEEIAQILKKPVGTIKARISRGRNFLKKRLQKALAGGSVSS